jgi:hypothetical protein
MAGTHPVRGWGLKPARAARQPEASLGLTPCGKAVWISLTEPRQGRHSCSPGCQPREPGPPHPSKPRRSGTGGAWAPAQDKRRAKPAAVSFSMAWGLRPQAGCCRPCRGLEGEGSGGVPGVGTPGFYVGTGCQVPSSAFSSKSPLRRHPPSWVGAPGFSLRSGAC